jgi:hypothetical protein
MKKDRMILFAAVVFLAVASGLLGGLFSRRLLLGNGVYFGDYDFSRPGGQSPSLLISNPRKVEVLPEQRLAASADSTAPGFLAVFSKKGTSSEYYLPQASGQAYAVTSDGWLISAFVPASAKASSSKAADLAASHIFIDKKGRRYQADSFIYDPVSTLSFWHIPANDLPVRQFAEADSLSPGRALYLQDWRGRLRESSLAYVRRGGAFPSSEPRQEVLELSRLSSADAGSMVFDLEGRLAAVVRQNGEAFSISNLSACINCLLSEGRIIRPYLGIIYSDLSESAGPDERFGQGFRLSKDGDRPAVAKASPAEKAGLKEGDIIVSANGDKFEEGSHLATWLSSRKPGEKISFDIRRGDQELSVSVALGEWLPKQ